MKQVRPLPAAVVTLGLFAFSNATVLAQPGWHNEIGYTQLVEEFGVVANGSGVAVALVEGSGGGGFMPDLANAEFADKNITQESPGEATPSGHATGMAATFFGKTTSVAPGVTDVSCFSANDWLNIWLGAGTPLGPRELDFAVSNHSYIGDGLPEEVAANILLRADYAINEFGMTTVVGINNGSNNAQPQILSHAYNVISVGKTDGNHSRGETTVYGRGRPKPEIVAPAGTTSEATAIVSSVAALLYDAADDTEATEPEVLKAILLAGATKSECSDWSRTILNPLDAAFGAGEVNVYHSYRIVAGGQGDGSVENPGTAAPLPGWDYNSTIEANVPTFYAIELPRGGTELSVTLCWNVDIVDSDPGEPIVPTTELADMELRLFDSTNGFLQSLVDSSVDTEGNIEHIYQTTLPPGRYTLEVRSNRVHDYGLAWRVEANADPATP